MYSTDKNIADAQKVMLEILLELHKICEKNNIIYWLDAGTLLGAVRHKGFIPWDDDCDVSMPRSDYEKFIKIVQNELPANMFLQTKETDPNSNFDMIKIRKLKTKLIEEGETGKENYCHGIFVDIFPYDNYKYKWFVKWMQWSWVFREKKKQYQKGSFKRFGVQIWTNVICYVPFKLSVCMRKYFEKHQEYFNNNKFKYFTYGLSSTICRTTKKDDVLPVVLHKKCFEGYSFYLPRNPDAVLKANYGSDYMVLPPIEKRKTHAKYIKVDCE